MKSISWKFPVFVLTAAVLLFIIPGFSSAETLLGKLTLIGADGRTDVYPLVSGNKIAYGQRALLRVAGGTFVVEEGSDLTVAGQDENLSFRIGNGIIHFRIQPHKTVISFNTRNGNFKTPGVVKAASSIIEGTITVNEKETVLELSEGSMQALTAEGVETVNAGDRVVLVTQAVLEESPAGENGNSDSETPADDNPDQNADGNADQNAGNEDGGDGDLAGAAVFGGTTAAAITGTVIGASTNGNARGDKTASTVE